jgi:2-C-methyl-D-erythritol 4-phosphate cytidylyltransferase
VTEVDVLVLAAGRGERLDGQPKAWLALRGETLLERMARVGGDLSDSVIAAVPPRDLERAQRLIGGTARAIAGGETRHATFLKLVAAATAPSLVILDVAHPLVTADLCRRVMSAAGSGAAAAVLRAHDEVIRSDGSAATTDGPLYLLSKPIVVPLDAVRRGLASAGDGGDTGVLRLLRSAGERLKLVDVEPWNVKLTTHDDWSLIKTLADRLAEKGHPS